VGCFEMTCNCELSTVSSESVLDSEGLMALRMFCSSMN